MFNKSDFILKKTQYLSSYEYETENYKIKISENEFSDETVSYMQKFVEIYPIKVKDIAKAIMDLEWFKDYFPEESMKSVEKKLGKPIFNYNSLYTIITYVENTIDENHIIDVEIGGMYEVFYNISFDG